MAQGKLAAAWIHMAWDRISWCCLHRVIALRQTCLLYAVHTCCTCTLY
jgi:hypothetical protein